VKRIIPAPKLYEIMIAPFLETVQDIDECRAVKEVFYGVGDTSTRHSREGGNLGLTVG